MEFKYSVSILFSNLGYAFKILLWIVISLLLTLGIGVAIVVPVWDSLCAVSNAQTYANALRECVRNAWTGSISIRGALGELIAHAGGLLGEVTSHTGIAVGLAFEFLFLYAFYCFMFGLSYYSLADIINNVMASNMKFGFASNMALNLKKSFKYSLARLTITLPLDIVILAVMGALLALFKHIGYFVLPIILVVGVVLCSLRATLLSGWLPRLLFHPEEKVYTGFTRSLTYVKYNANGLFKSYAVMFSIIYILFTTLAIPTGGLMTIVLPAIYYFILRAIELVGYYKTKGLSFYTDATTVINTVEFGYREEQQDDDFDYGANAIDEQITIDEYIDGNND